MVDFGSESNNFVNYLAEIINRIQERLIRPNIDAECGSRVNWILACTKPEEPEPAVNCRLPSSLIFKKACVETVRLAE